MPSEPTDLEPASLPGLPHVTDVVSVTLVDGEPIVLMTRTAEPLPMDELGLEMFYQSLDALFSQLPTAGLSLIVDARNAPGRNDAVFERLQAKYRQRLFFRFRHTVAVVGSSAGRLQLRRYAREERKSPYQLHEDVESAIADLRERA